MNLYELQNNFWRLSEFENFSGNETKLYFYLLYLANRAYWAEWIDYPDSKMTVNMGFSTQVLRTAKLKLKESGLIDFVIGGGFRCKSKYQILTPSLPPRLSDYIKTKDKNNNTNTYGKKKGFIYSGSDFD